MRQFLTSKAIACHLVVAAVLVACGTESDATVPPSSDGRTVALIVKDPDHPFFASMAESAQAEAMRLGVTVTVSGGEEIGDTDGQIDAIEAAVTRRDIGIVIAPSGDAVVPALTRARQAGLFVVVLDTPLDDPAVADATFATDNFEAGQLIGRWAAITLNGQRAEIAMLDLLSDQVVSVDTGRDQGFLTGMGILTGENPSGNGLEPPTGRYSGGEYRIVCRESTRGSVDGGRAAMEACLAVQPGINVIYTVNELAAQGAYEALRAAGRDDDVLIVSVDGGCSPGLDLVEQGIIDATAQQYPGDMAALGLRTLVDLADETAAPEASAGLDFIDTGVALVTDNPVDGVASISVEAGRARCWG